MWATLVQGYPGPNGEDGDRYWHLFATEMMARQHELLMLKQANIQLVIVTQITPEPVKVK